MAVGKSQHSPLMAAGPTLGQQLFPRINRKAPVALPHLGPYVATGPDRLQQQHGIDLLPQQQGAAFERGRRRQHPCQLIGQPEIRPYQSWRL